MEEVYIAHISEDGRNSQLLEDHLLNVAQLAKKFGASIGAVSYTHLDVYKRQVICFLLVFS